MSYKQCLCSINSFELSFQQFLTHDRARQYIGPPFFDHKSPAARELFTPSTDSASLVVKIEKKIFRFGFELFWGNITSRGVFALFWPSLPGPAPFFGLKIQLKTRSKSVSIEPLIDFPAYRERKLWLITQKLTKILLPQKQLCEAFHPRQ